MKITEEKKEYNRKYYIKNKIKMSDRKKILYTKNKEAILNKNKEWRLDNKKHICKYNRTEDRMEASRLYSQKRRALKASTTDGSVTIKNTQKLLDEQGGACNICGLDITERTSRHLDHIHPLSKLGVHSIDNVQWLCIHCNLHKSDNLFL